LVHYGIGSIADRRKIMNGDILTENLTPHSTISISTATKKQQYDRVVITNLSDKNNFSETRLVWDEVARLRELYEYQVLDTPSDSKLDELTMLAAEICQAPIALISFVDRDRQWFKSKVGLSISETPRHIAFCAQAIQQASVFVVPDALVDQRFSSNPLVVKDPKIRFYAGVPLITPSGFPLGTLCVIDYIPRELSPQQLRALETLNHQVMAQLELERETVKLQQVSTKFQQLQQQFTERESLSQQESILLNLANQIRHSLDLDTILQTSVDEIRNLLEVDRCFFLWFLPNGGQFHLTVTHEARLRELPSLIGELPNDDSQVLTNTISDLKILQINDVNADTNLSRIDQNLLLKLGIRSTLLLPLKTYSGQFGAIVCSQKNNARFWTEGEAKLLRAVTDQLAIALDQAELYAQTRSTALAAQTQAQYLADALQRLQQTQAQLVQHEKMSSLGQLVAGVAHEINNPVNFISGNINYANDYIRDILELLKLYQQHYPEPHWEIQERVEAIDLEFIMTDLPKLLSSMNVGVERINQIVRSLRNFSRLDEAEMKPVNIHDGIDSTLLILQNRLKANSMGQSIQVNRNYKQLPLVECYAGQLNQVFMNILSNAIDALDEVTDHPTITISTDLIPCVVVDVQDSIHEISVNHVVIRIQDNGMGMAEAVQQKLFNPFFTTKPVGKGTGLGLSISYQIVVEKHKGLLKCASQVGQGTEFEIQIPVEPLPSTVEQR
jgi:signal transduction histidine kinase